MGVIQRQGIKQSIVTYLSTFIGAINVLFISTAILSKEELGFYNFFIATGTMIMPFAMFGVNSLVIRFYPEFKNKSNGDNGFLRLLLLLVSVGLLSTTSIIYIFQEQIQAFYADKMEGFESLFLLFIPLILFQGYNAIFTNMATNHHRIVVPTIFNNLFLKIALPLFCILYYYEFINFKGLLIGIVAVIGCNTIGYILYLWKLGALKLHRINWSFLTKKRSRELRNFMLFGILVGLGSRLAFFIDIFMVGSLTTISLAASYSIALFIADVINIPKNALGSISSPIIAKAWKENDLSEIKMVYQKSSLNLFIYACIILVLIWSSINDLFMIIPNGDTYKEGVYVVLILGLARLIDSVTSVNDQVISLSKYYKFGFVSVLLLAVINILNNLWLIPAYYINGAAIATLISICIFNLAKLLFIWVKIGFQPFQWNHLKTLITAITCYLIGQSIPFDFHPFFNIVFRSSLIGILYIVVLLQFNLSPDINKLLITLIEKFKKVRD